MPKKPLKITWRNWCLYKLARRDYSTFEMSQLIQKRAADSLQEVDPEPIVSKLVDEGLIDDDRYIKSQIRGHTQSFNIKGPKQIRLKLKHKGGIPAEQIDLYIDDADPQWSQLAKKCFQKFLLEKGLNTEPPIFLPIKELQKIKQKLYQKGFSAAQTNYALKEVVLRDDSTKTFDSEEVKRWINRRMSDGRGPMDIKQYLKGKGVDSDTITTHLCDIDEVWGEIAKEALQKRFNPDQKGTAKEKRKQIDFLLRRGFNMHHVNLAYASL